MTLANIAAAPTEQTQSAFDYSHFQDHVEIAQAINKQQATNLAVRPIFPAPGQGQTWKQMHQAMHTEMNAALGNNGQNLQGEIDNVWHDQNYREHQAARAKLGI